MPNDGDAAGAASAVATLDTGDDCDDMLKWFGASGEEIDFCRR